MPYNCPSRLDKRRLIDAYLDDPQNYLNVARILNINRKTAYCIIRRYLERGHEDFERGGPRAQKTNEEMLAAAVIILEENPLIALDDLNVRIR